MNKDLLDSISYKDIGSLELRKQVISDISYLFDLAEQESILPKMLIVGKFFVYFTSIDSVIAELGIKDWSNACKSPTFNLIKDIWISKILSVYENCEKNCGKFKTSVTKSDDIDIYVDPDEFYITLKCIDPHSKNSLSNKEGKLIKEECSKDGYKIVTLTIPRSEVLSHFINNYINN